LDNAIPRRRNDCFEAARDRLLFKTMGTIFDHLHYLGKRCVLKIETHSSEISLAGKIERTVRPPRFSTHVHITAISYTLRSCLFDFCEVVIREADRREKCPPESSAVSSVRATEKPAIKTLGTEKLANH
jgi:hypothetical protein